MPPPPKKKTDPSRPLSGTPERGFTWVGRLQSYPQTLAWAGKACQGQTL
jgi:hypothetical protein